MAISTVIFDMGGVLVWTHWERASEPLASMAGISPDMVTETIRKGEAYFPLMSGEIDFEEFALRVTADLGIQMPTDRLMDLWNSILAPNPDAGPVLGRLQGGCRLVLGSNTDPEHYQRSVEVQPALALFDDALLSYDLGVCKPDPAFFTSGLARLGLSAEECVFIDDLADNVASAVGLGITGIQFESMAQVEGQLERLGLL